MPNYYQSNVRVLLTWVEMQSKMDTLGYDLGVRADAFLNPYIEVINSLLYSNATLDQIAEEFDFYRRYRVADSRRPKERVRERLRKALSIKQITTISAPLFYILEIRFVSRDPALSAQVATRSVELLEESFRNITMEQIYNKQLFIEERLRTIENQMDQSKAEIFAFRRRYGSIDLATQAREQNALISELRADIVRKEVELGNLSKYAAENDARLVRLRGEIERKQQLISELKEGSDHDFVPLERIPQLQLELRDLEQNLEMLEELYVVLKKESETVKIEESNKLKNFQVIEAATLPEIPIGPNRFLVCVVTVFFVLLIAMLWAFFKEYIESLNRTPGESDKLETIKRLLVKIR
jgi:uncharacterized protein involved in exopolysaccharide biosynthesis